MDRGFNVAWVRTASECKAKLATQFFDIAILDFQLPDASGLDLLSEIAHAVPVVFYTGHGSEDVAVQAMKRGAVDYIVKSGAHIQLLPTVVEESLEKLRLREELRTATRALDLSELRYRDLFENAYDPIFVVDENGDFLDANLEMMHLLEIDREGLLNANLLDYLVEDSKVQGFLDFLAHAFEQGNRDVFTLALRSPSSYQVTLEVRARVVHVGEGHREVQCIARRQVKDEEVLTPTFEEST